MLGKNPFKIIEEENIRKFEENGPQVPAFLNKVKDSSIKKYNRGFDSPTFPSFS